MHNFSKYLAKEFALEQAGNPPECFCVLSGFPSLFLTESIRQKPQV